MAMLFTEVELDELRRADAELDEEFTLTPEDLEFSRQLDKEAKLDRLDNRSRKIAARSAAYYEANKHRKFSTSSACAVGTSVIAKKNAASDGANIESSKGNISICIIKEKGGNVNDWV